MFYFFFFFFSSRRRHTRFSRDWSSDVCSSDLDAQTGARLAELSPPYRDTVTSSDRRWQYVAELVRLGGEWHLIISLIDLERGAITRRFPLGPPTASPAQAAPNLMIQLLL